jgi:hypothetical protein
MLDLYKLYLSVILFLERTYLYFIITYSKKKRHYKYLKILFNRFVWGITLKLILLD